MGGDRACRYRPDFSCRLLHGCLPRDFHDDHTGRALRRRRLRVHRDGLLHGVGAGGLRPERQWSSPHLRHGLLVQPHRRARGGPRADLRRDRPGPGRRLPGDERTAHQRLGIGAGDAVADRTLQGVRRVGRRIRPFRGLRRAVAQASGGRPERRRQHSRRAAQHGRQPDGRTRNIATPSMDAQIAASRAALAVAGVDPTRSVSSRRTAPAPRSAIRSSSEVLRRPTGRPARFCWVRRSRISVIPKRQPAQSAWSRRFWSFSTGLCHRWCTSPVCPRSSRTSRPG